MNEITRILISTPEGEEGGIFDGTPEQFDDCFGITMSRPITEAHVKFFCEVKSNRFVYRLEFGSSSSCEQVSSEAKPMDNGTMRTKDFPIRLISMLITEASGHNGALLPDGQWADTSSIGTRQQFLSEAGLSLVDEDLDGFELVVVFKEEATETFWRFEAFVHVDGDPAEITGVTTDGLHVTCRRVVPQPITRTTWVEA